MTNVKLIHETSRIVKSTIETPNWSTLDMKSKKNTYTKLRHETPKIQKSYWKPQNIIWKPLKKLTSYMKPQNDKIYVHN